jgi:hypothetical protein
VTYNEGEGCDDRHYQRPCTTNAQGNNNNNNNNNNNSASTAIMRRVDVRNSSMGQRQQHDVSDQHDVSERRPARPDALPATAAAVAAAACIHGWPADHSAQRREEQSRHATARRRPFYIDARAKSHARQRASTVATSECEHGGGSEQWGERGVRGGMRRDQHGHLRTSHCGGAVNDAERRHLVHGTEDLSYTTFAHVGAALVVC